MKRIMIFMTLLFIGTTYLQADESEDDARLANAIKKYQAEKQKRTTNSNKENHSDKDNFSDSDKKIIEPSLSNDPTNADPEPQGKSNLPPS
jgi:hypothetical protein